MFVLYAHRGASSYAPENTMRSFRLGHEQGANGIETDIQCTKDGELVLFHDEYLQNLTGKNGKVCEYKFDELLSLTVRNPDGTPSDNSIPRLEELLCYAKNNNLFLALELKQDNLVEKTIAQIENFLIQSTTTVTSFNYDHIKEIKNHHSNIRTGYLIHKIEDHILDQMKQINAEEICPYAATLTSCDVAKARKHGLSIRAWGVRDIEDAKKVISLGIDGMTVNFPDLCAPYLK